MPRISMWNPRKSYDYYFIDRIVKEQFYIGGTGVYVHKYVGPYQNEASDDASKPNYAAGSEANPSGIVNETHIQDLLFLENRDRRYEKDIYELRGAYNVSDNDFDLTQYAVFLTNDTLYMTFHINDMVETIGRKLMSGDVLELPHLLDELGLEVGKEPLPKFYVVQDANRGGEGFSQTWWPHIWRVKIGPIKDSQEFAGILGDPGDGGVGDTISIYQKTLDITNAVVTAAKNNSEFYDTALSSVLFGDGIPDGYGENIPSGNTFPSSANIGEYFVRTDFQPNRLFIKRATRWERIFENTSENHWESTTFNSGAFVQNTDEKVGHGDREFATRQPVSNPIPPRDMPRVSE